MRGGVSLIRVNDTESGVESAIVELRKSCLSWDLGAMTQRLGSN